MDTIVEPTGTVLVHGDPLRLQPGTEFDIDRQRFVSAFRAFMGNAAVPASIREAEYLATVSEMSKIAVLAEVTA